MTLYRSWEGRDKVKDASTDEPLLSATDVMAAFRLLTRLPVPQGPDRGGKAAWAWPLVGAVLGLITAVVAACLLGLSVPPILVAVAAVTTTIFLTGALHEDGLADVADGFWGGYDPARRLEIMKDSRVGSYGVLALVLSLFARVAAVTVLIEAGAFFPALIAAGALSRAPMAVLMATMPPARAGGLSARVGAPEGKTALVALALALVIAALVLGQASLAPILWASLATIAVAILAFVKIGGQTGDVLGASQQAAEIAALTALTAVLA